MKALLLLFQLALFILSNALWAQAQRVVDVPTRPAITQRGVVLEPQMPRATVGLFAGGQGGLQISSDGSFKRGEELSCAHAAIIRFQECDGCGG